MTSLRKRTLCVGLSLFTLFAVAVAGCSTTPRDFGSGGAGGGSSSSQGTGGAGSQSSSASGTGGQGGGLPTVCAPGLPPWPGPLCGPPDRPCKALTDEVLKDPPTSRIGPPSIALDSSCSPQILFDNNVGKFNGFHAVRGGPDQWAINPTPFPITSSGFTLLDDGTPLVLGDDYAIWQKPKGGVWSVGPALAKTFVANADSFARASDGTLHMGLYNYMDNNAYHGQLPPGASLWQTAQVGAMISTAFPLALSPAGDPHMTFWTSTGANGWVLSWISPPGKVEVATPLGSNLLDFGAQQQKLVVTAADASNPLGKPHVLFVRSLVADPKIHELVTVERTKPGAWTVTSIETENPAGQFCAGKPAAGQMCNFDYEELGTLGIVTSKSGDVRFVYGKIHHQGTSIGTCTPQVPMICFWSVQTDLSVGEVRVGWLDANGNPASAQVASKVMPNTGRVVVDTVGHLHVAMLDEYPPKQGGLTVHYLEIGP